ncbi:hydroxypyruvate isomerase [Saccharopolyspora rhizosphaerae]|uniref:Hydroxypyruvate isomerase n=1 Tax=Saccharopolyspora rhizosphaerae TaxID=2492662 RepID=A0A3R8QXK9_9PSEU|nr:hydroxypyruvate isomerase [Saccharopolyspora rhizosphaerae]
MTDRFDVNLSILFTELDLLERPAAAKAAGFDRVEFWWPFDSAVPAEADVEAFIRAIDDAGVSLVGLNFYGGDLVAGERGVLSDPDRAGQFAANIDVLCEIGERLGCRAFNALYGNRIDGVDPRAQDEAALASLVRAARDVARIGGTVLVEPVSGIPDYPLRTAADGLAVVDRVREADGADNVRLLLDLYHLVTNEDDPDVVLDERPESIGHVQIADSPGRGEPGTGRIDFVHYFAKLDEVGYTGHIGLEYKPSGASTEAFGWISR